MNTIIMVAVVWTLAALAGSAPFLILLLMPRLLG